MSTTEAGTPVFDASGYPHADGEATQLWVDGPAVPPEGGAGLELVLVAVLDGGVLLLALVLLAAVLDGALVVGALVVGRTVLLVGDGLLLGADEVDRIGGRW